MWYFIKTVNYTGCGIPTSKQLKFGKREDKLRYLLHRGSLSTSTLQALSTQRIVPMYPWDLFQQDSTIY